MDDLPSDMQLTPRAVGVYLSSSGWELQHVDRAREIWALVERGTPRARLMLPLDETFADFRLRFDEALSRLCMIHDWDIVQLATSVVGARSDFFYIRADQMIRHDSIPLRQAEQLVAGATKLLTAAAWATVKPKSVFTGRQPGAVRDFISDDVRMGHTQRGSFVITVLTQLADDDVLEPSAAGDRSGPDGSNDSDDDSQWDSYARDGLDARDEDEVRIPPFQRRVMSTLATALRSTHEITDPSAHFFSLSEAVDRGVSAQLCESLDEMTSFEGLHSLEMSFRWAPAEIVPPPDISDVTIDRGRVENIRRISRSLRERNEGGRVSIFGQVAKLERPDDADDGDAVVTVRGVSGKNTRRQVRVRLSDRDHETAISSYRNRTPLVVTGDLRREGKFYWLRGNVVVDDMSGGEVNGSQEP